MRKTVLGKTGIEISVMGLGTMYFGSKVDERTSFRLFDLYLEHGGNFIDSANKYASWIPGGRGGESESLIGKWIRQHSQRGNLILSSKVGFPYGEVPRSLKKELTIMAHSPLLGGIYGKEGVDIPPQYQSLASSQKLDSLRALCSKSGYSPNQLVLSWMLYSSPVVIPLVTGSNEQQLKENLEAASIILSKEDMEILDRPVIEPIKY